MIRVVIDTNVLVSALLTSGGLPEAVIDLAISGDLLSFASESVLAEYEEVLKRPRLAIDSGKEGKNRIITELGMPVQDAFDALLIMNPGRLPSWVVLVL
jgi:putative PIN family toxin of toxin-antitoxin system